MYNIYLNADKSKYELNELIKMFLKPSEFQVFEGENAMEGTAAVGEDNCFWMPQGVEDKNQAKRILYDWLHIKTGQKPDWGTLTGVRPGKLAGEYLSNGASEDELHAILANTYYLSEEKIQLLLSLCRNQRRAIGSAPKGSVGIYIGIPFCPTRCLYCSFTSNQATEAKIAAYLTALYQEIAYVGDLMKRRGLWPESIYIGGGTPTTLNEKDLGELLSFIQRSFDMSLVKEFTVEAGRPDTITEGKLQTIKAHGAGRISINPQTMKAHTLELIGRSHSPKQIEEAFKLAKSVGIPIINADVIAGLPEETPDDFRNSLEKIVALEPENITVHTLAVKKASRLIEVDADYHYKQGNTVREMLAISKEIMEKNLYLPYYMYRQKHMTGNFENVGYALAGTENIYNVRIMEENQTIIALGAGGISKVCFPEENRLERVPNVSNYEIYIDRLDEMLERKERGIL